MNCKSGDKASEEEFVWKFSISPNENIDQQEHILIEFIRCELRAILDIVQMMHGKKTVEVDGFRIRNFPDDIIYPID